MNERQRDGVRVCQTVDQQMDESPGERLARKPFRWRKSLT